MKGKSGPTEPKDPYLWLEEIDGPRQLQWVRRMNSATMGVLSKRPEYRRIYRQCLEILDSAEKIAYPSIKEKHVYNFWKDRDHPRGIWRRAGLAGYLGVRPRWETLIDIDRLSKREGMHWDFHGAAGLFPKHDRFLVHLSPGGGDASVIREYDGAKRAFVKGGFTLEKSKGDAVYLDRDRLLVCRDFGRGTMTTSGYPRQVRLWRRGTDIGRAPVLLEAPETDVRAWAYTLETARRRYFFLARGHTFYSNTFYAYDGGRLIKLAIPRDAMITDMAAGQAIIKLKSDWKVRGETFRQGSLVSADYRKLLEGRLDLKLIVEPDGRSSVQSSAATKNRLVVGMLSDVKGRLRSFRLRNGRWIGDGLRTPECGTIAIGSADPKSDKFFLYFEDFLTPSTLHYADAVKETMRRVKAMLAFFDGSKHRTWQHWATSRDGTKVPYFVVGPKGMRFDGGNPTVLYAYGGFLVSQVPYYLATLGRGWLERGGVYVLANIRGGGEFGPRWHRAGLREKRQNVFDDFYAVAEDLMARGITSPRHLGIKGGSNGGLLVGAAMTQRPELFGAVVCGVPLLDMRRYSKLLAGASWMAEYGDPDKPGDWDYIKKYSPYHNLRAGREYPEVLFATSTRDDRVHPGHARKMAAKMKAMGFRVRYYENIEGGHAGSSTNAQTARRLALEFAFLLTKLR